MITPEQWNVIGKKANKIYNQLELEIIQEIAERIANVGYANTVVLNDILIAQEMGVMYEHIVQLVAKYNNTSASQIKEIFETAGIKSLDYDDKIYKLAGLEPKPLKQSKGMWQLLSATAIKTHNNLNNLVMTTANTSQTQFYNAMNKYGIEHFKIEEIDDCFLRIVNRDSGSTITPSSYKKYYIMLKGGILQ